MVSGKVQSKIRMNKIYFFILLVSLSLSVRAQSGKFFHTLSFGQIINPEISLLEYQGKNVKGINFSNELNYSMNERFNASIGIEYYALSKKGEIFNKYDSAPFNVDLFGMSIYDSYTSSFFGLSANIYFNVVNTDHHMFQLGGGYCYGRVNEFATRYSINWKELQYLGSAYFSNNWLVTTQYQANVYKKFLLGVKLQGSHINQFIYSGMLSIGYIIEK